MIENNTTVFEIFTGDDEMYGRLSRALALWSEAMCLRLKILRGKVSAPACGTSDLVIIDMSSDDRFLPAQPCDGCAVLAVARGDEQCMRAYRRHPPVAARARL